MFNWFKKKEVPMIALPPDINFAHEVVKKKIDASLKKEEETFCMFQIWLSHFVSDCIEKGQYVSFSTEIKKDGFCETESGTIFRRFYEQGSSTLSFSHDLLNKMKEWILGDFSIMYAKAGYIITVNESRFEISWTQAKTSSEK